MLRLFIIGLLLLTPMTAISQPPSPTPRETIKKPNANTENKKNDSQITAPISSSIPDKPDAIPSNEEHKKNASPEWWLVYLTGALVLVTGGLMIFTARLWKSTKLLSEDAKNTSDRQASEMLKSLELTQKSLDLAREEFISTHRPQLIVRNVNIKPPHPIAPDICFEDGNPITLEWSVVNVGDTPAVIVESNATAIMSAKAFSSRIEHSNVRDTMGATKFLAGENYPFSLTAEDIVFPNYGAFSQLIMPPAEKVIYFFGFIDYKDAIGTIRRTAFCRSYDPIEKRFLIIDDPDHEYAD